MPGLPDASSSTAQVIHSLLNASRTGEEHTENLQHDLGSSSVSVSSDLLSIPDWRLNNKRTYPFKKRLEGPQIQSAYSASGRDGVLKSHIGNAEMITFDGDILYLHGFKVDAIMKLKSFNTKYLASPSYEHDALLASDLAKSIPPDNEDIWIQGESVSEAFWRTVKADIKYDGLKAVARGATVVEPGSKAAQVDHIRDY